MIVLSLKYSCLLLLTQKIKIKSSRSIQQSLFLANQYDTNSFQSVLGSLASNPEKKKRHLYRDKLIVLLYLIATEQKNYCKLHI